jgi:histone arginine demethylase JMJD6
MHFHGDAYNVLAHGLKAWYLLPPEQAQYSTVPALAYVQQLLPQLQEAEGAGAHWQAPLQCLQAAGDVLYVPRGWGHAVLNLNTSVGYAGDFVSAHRRY